MNGKYENAVKVKPLNEPLIGSVEVSADKSISHRSAIIGALCEGVVEVTNFSKGADCKSTLEVLKKLGVEVQYKSETNLIISAKNRLLEPEDILDAGNSGTTMRLMSGVLSGQDFYSVMTGDESLRNRPMARVINPLKQMGASICARCGDTKAPLTIKGGGLKGIFYDSPIASAQVKSAVILAGLFAQGETSFKEPYKSRDHSERLLKYFGCNLEENGTTVTVKKSRLCAKPVIVPGDISSAAFFIVAGAIVKDSCLKIKDIGLNPTRTGIIDVMKKMGAEIKISDFRIQSGEEVGDIEVCYSNLKGVEINAEMIPLLIDEIPIIAVAATQAEGTTVIRGAEDLRHKESDRLKAVCSQLSLLGANIEETKDGLIIEGKTKLKGGCVLESFHDHRIAMSNYIASLITENETVINDFNWVNISFPEFLSIFEGLKAG